MKKLMLLFSLLVVATAMAFLSQPVWSCGEYGQPDCQNGNVHNVNNFHPNIHNNPSASATSNPVITANPTNTFNPSVSGGAGGQGGQGGQGGSATGGTGGSVGTVTGGSIGDIVNKILNPREFSQLPPAMQQQFGPLLQTMWLKHGLDVDAEDLVEALMGPVPLPEETLSLETIWQNAGSRFSFNFKDMANEFLLLELLVKGDKGMENFKPGKVEFLTNKQTPGPSEGVQFVQEVRNGKHRQVVDPSRLRDAGWAVRTALPLKGVAGTSTSGMKWWGFGRLMKTSGYKHAAVLSVIISNVAESSGKNAGIGGSQQSFSGSLEDTVRNMFLSGAKGSGQNWQSIRVDIIVGLLERIQPDAPMVILPPIPPKKEEAVPPKEEPKKEAAAPSPPPPEKKAEATPSAAVPVSPPSVVVNPLDSLPEFPSIHFELASDEIVDFQIGAVKFENSEALREIETKFEKHVLPLMEKDPKLQVLVTGGTCDYGPKGMLPTKLKSGKKIPNTVAYNRGGLGGERANNLAIHLVTYLLKSGMKPELQKRFIVSSIGFSENFKLSDKEAGVNLGYYQKMMSKEDFEEFKRTLLRGIRIWVGRDITTNYPRLIDVKPKPKISSK